MFGPDGSFTATAVTAGADWFFLETRSWRGSTPRERRSASLKSTTRVQERRIGSFAGQHDTMDDGTLVIARQPKHSPYPILLRTIVFLWKV